MPNAPDDAIVVGGLDPVDGKVSEVPTHKQAYEKEIIAVDAARADTDTTGIDEKNPATDSENDIGNEGVDGESPDENIIITGADAARYLLPSKKTPTAITLS